MILPLLQSVVLVGGTVHTMVPGAEPQPQTIFIEDGRITSVTAPDQALELPEDVLEIDVTGLHLVPGLIDGLANHDADHDALYVARGITLIRDHGNELERIVNARTAAASSLTVGPDLFVAGLVLDGDPPLSRPAAVFVDAAGAKIKMDALLEYEIDFFSASAGLPEPALLAAVVHAHRSGRQLWGPLPNGSNLQKVIRSRMHGLFGLEAFRPAGKTWDLVSKADFDAPIASLKDKELAFTPLMGVFARALTQQSEDPIEYGYLGPHYVQAWKSDLQMLRARFADKEIRARAEKVVELQLDLVKRLHEAGVKLVPGSAAPNPWLFPGDSLHAELALFVRAGIAPAEVLRLATAGAAEALGVADERGTLQAGMIADIVAVGSDPTQTLSSLRDPELVVLRGKVLEREDVGAMLTKLTTLQSERLAEINKPVDVAPPSMPEGKLLLAGQAERSAFDQRISSEHFNVVQMNDGRIAYGTRIVTPGGASSPTTEVELVQRIKDDQLESFDMAIHVAGHTMTVKGLLLAGKLNVERRRDGGFLSNDRARELIEVVDINSVTTDLIISQHWKEGDHFVIYFEEVEPVVGKWTMKVNESDRQILVRPGLQGDAIQIGIDELGGPLFSFRRSGVTHSSARVTEIAPTPGLAIDPSRVYQAPEEEPTGEDAAADGE
jgi:hypothetical protein